MRLRDLDACFVGGFTAPHSYRRLDSMEGAQGLLFQCPQCAQGKERAEDGGFVGAHYVLIWFRSPRGSVEVPESAQPAPARWTVSGDSLDNLTLDPSVNLVKKDPSECGWHGWVKKGEAA
jgi:hypothetical protein